MKNFSTQEIKEIIKFAKELGATFIKIDGLEVGLDPATNSSDKVNELTYEEVSEIKEPTERWKFPVRKSRNKNSEKVPTHCEDCSEEMLPGNWGKPYCRSCYIERKERNGN